MMQIPVENVSCGIYKFFSGGMSARVTGLSENGDMTKICILSKILD